MARLVRMVLPGIPLFKEESPDLEKFREHFRTGRPLGDDRFLRKAEALIKRELRPKNQGSLKK